MKIFYFISDSHFGSDEPEREKIKQNQLFSFLEEISKGDSHLYILGDFFEIWFEYKNAMPKCYFHILVALSRLVESGVGIDLIVGNHDYWVHNFLQREIGIRVHQKPVDVMLHGKRFYIAHGDGLIKSNIASVILSGITKNPVNIFLYRLLSPDFSIPLASFSSKLSRNRNSRNVNPDDVKGKYAKFAQRKLMSGFDGVILGHTHQPVLTKYGDKVYLNTGDWLETFSYGKLDNGNLSLNYWRPENSHNLNISQTRI